MGAQIGDDGKYSNPFGLDQDWSWAKPKSPEPSLRDRFGRVILALSVILVLNLCMIAFVFVPLLFLNTLLMTFAFFVITMAILRIFAVLFTLNGIGYDISSREELETIWPRFTILVPLYQEAHMVPQLMDNLQRLDYPRDRLNIILVCEADDQPTCDAVRQLLHTPFEIFEVPPSHPRTKPKALNAALHALSSDSRGDIVSVYDAEDRPHPDQLKQAASRFLADPDIGAVQAPLGYYNDTDNILTALFGLEYAALFHVWNPALAKFGFPFTLGGTSNHIRRSILEQAGGWDAHNVTEDADLGFRIFSLNRHDQTCKIATITLATDEEAVGNYRQWAAQRSRWLKGFMQTWLVHMRAHKTAVDGGNFPLGTRVKSFISLQITLGATLFAAFLHLPSVVIMATLFAADNTHILSIAWPLMFFLVMITGYSAAILTAIIGAIRARKYHLIKFTFLMPLYWLLLFWPALIAAYEIIYAPAYWHKTIHLGTTPTQPPSAKDDKNTRALESKPEPLI